MEAKPSSTSMQKHKADQHIGLMEAKPCSTLIISVLFTETLNSELWHACAGPLVSLPHVDSPVYYFPQGQIEQGAAPTTRIPNYPNLPSQLLCQVQNLTLHADKETEEIYAQMSLQPLHHDVFIEVNNLSPLPSVGLKANVSKHLFCKTLTASDTIKRFL
ncbi:auxin response factor 5-like [Cicer arietinum]|uniref:Auxin response factor 5-like n=1 Tax=Cicer arietinum TaxID=3827 RepID=A0A1S2Y5U3_CICAR|nr:auxin response factor 5-like [Cicer arietinum]